MDGIGVTSTISILRNSVFEETLCFEIFEFFFKNKENLVNSYAHRFGNLFHLVRYRTGTVRYFSSSILLKKKSTIPYGTVPYRTKIFFSPK